MTSSPSLFSRGRALRAQSVALTWFLSGCGSSCAGGPPPAFDTLRGQLSGDARIYAELSWPRPGLPVEETVVVEIGPKEASVAVSEGRAWTDGTTLKVGDGDVAIPLLDVADEAAELFAELRAGLSNSRWTPIDPPLAGPVRLAADATWAEVVLPFDWMSGESVLLAVQPDDGRLRYVVVQTDDPPLTVSTRPPRGGARTLVLSEDESLRLAVQSWSVETK